MSLKAAALLAGLTAILGGPRLLAWPAELRLDVQADAQALADGEDWTGLTELLEPWFEAGEEDVWAHDLAGRAHAALGDAPRAADHFDRALDLLAARGEDNGKEFRAIRQALFDVDPLGSRRNGFFNKVRRYFVECAEGLDKDGHDQLTLELLGRMEDLIQGPDYVEQRTLLEALRVANEEVDLDAVGSERIDGDRPLIDWQSGHYQLLCNLEEEVTHAVGETMDDIFVSYVQIYLGGDDSRAPKDKATIRIHGSWEQMVQHYPGQAYTPGLGGWWSPSENKVTNYDTRERSGSLDEMLGTLFHEASHQFMTMLSSRGGWSPAWLNEGTACFFEGAKAMQDHRVLWPDAAIGRLRNLAYFLGSGVGPKVADVIGFDQPGSYAGEYYCFGWGLVYYFQEYEDPETLAYTWRPYYLEYLEKITSEGGRPRELFDEIFLRPGNPGGFTSFEEFEAGWKDWILNQVYPLHSGNSARTLRLARAERYIDAADQAAVRRKAGVTEADLLERALRDLELVRTEIDSEDLPDGQVLQRQTEVLRRLDRPGAEAWAITYLLDVVDEGLWNGLDDDDYEGYTDRLVQINKSYWSMGRLRNRTRALRRDAAELLASYEQLDGFDLRSYTFAARAAALLKDPHLRDEADRLRGAAADAGTLRGQVTPIAGGTWSGIHERKPDGFEATATRVRLATEAGPNGRVCEDLELRGEYELRGKLVRDGELAIGTSHGLVIAGTADGDWTVLGIDYRGRLELRSVLRDGAGVSDSKIDFDGQLDPLCEDDEDPEFVVHVLPEGSLVVTIGDREPLEIELPFEMPRRSFPGIYAKNGTTILEDFVVETYP